MTRRTDLINPVRCRKGGVKNNIINPMFINSTNVLSFFFQLIPELRECHEKRFYGLGLSTPLISSIYISVFSVPRDFQYLLSADNKIMMITLKLMVMVFPEDKRH